MTYDEFPFFIDCRSQNDYVQGHRQGACSLPYDQLFERMHELPKRDQPLVVCIDAAHQGIVNGFFEDKGYTLLATIIWTMDYQAHLQQQGMYEVGTDSQRLWQPASLLINFIESVSPNETVQLGKGLDIACGSGRDMVYLASKGWQMTGIDYSQDALNRAQRLAHYYQQDIETHQIDLGKNPAEAFHSLPQYDLICVFRYLNRALFPVIHSALKPGGILIYQTFLQGCEKIGTPKNPNFILKPNELSDYFKDFTVLMDECHYLDDGRPVSAFIARKLS